MSEVSRDDLENQIRGDILDIHGAVIRANSVPEWAINSVALDAATNTMRAIRQGEDWRTEISPDSSQGMTAIPKKLQADICRTAMTAAERVMKGSIN